MSVEVNISFQKEWNIVIKITTFTPFRGVFHSKTCCPSFNSLNEWKVTRLHLESSITTGSWIIAYIQYVDLGFPNRKSGWYQNSIPHCNKMVVVVLRSPIHANEPSEYNGMLYRTSNRVLNNGIKVIILICMDGTSQYHHHQ